MTFNLFRVTISPLTLFLLLYAAAVNDQRNIMPSVGVIVLYGVVGLYAYLEFYQGVNYFIYDTITRPYRKLNVPIRARDERTGKTFAYAICSIILLIMAFIAIQLAK